MPDSPAMILCVIEPPRRAALLGVFDSVPGQRQATSFTGGLSPEPLIGFALFRCMIEGQRPEGQPAHASPPPYHPCLGFILQHLNDMSGQVLFDFSMSRNGLGHPRLWILIPVVPCSVAYEYAPHVRQPPDQVPTFHGTSNSAILRTQGMVPLVSSS